MEERVILVDENDREIGSAEKLEAHRRAMLHRAFSIFVFNSQRKLLLQKRANRKYHSGGLWSNTCCSHPRPGFSLLEEAQRKLAQEMGFECELHELFHFVYQVKLENGYWEHECDHVFVGNFDGNPTPNLQEVEDWKWMEEKELKEDLKKNPDHYTYWLRFCMDRVSILSAI
jgi:isopentenyl-diphosphate delta-isomerase